MGAVVVGGSPEHRVRAASTFTTVAPVTVGSALAAELPEEQPARRPTRASALTTVTP